MIKVPTDPQICKPISPTLTLGADWLATTGRQAADALAAAPGTSGLLHPDVIPALSRMQSDAALNGFTLAIASGYRSFDRQRIIWNSKATGQRPVLDSNGQPLDISKMHDDELLFAILRWSAIPGCSRHHWGTDMDVFDEAAVPTGYNVQLTTAEATGSGPFAPLHDWLDTYLASSDSEFFRPYALDTGGIAPERWHLSHRPTAKRYEQCLNETRLIDWLMTQDIALKTSIYKHWHTLFHRYVLVNRTAGSFQE